MIVFARESAADILADVTELAAQHWYEVTAYPSEAFKFDEAAHLALDEAGALRAYTVRNDGQLVAYLAFTVSRALHFAEPMAQSLALFVAPEHRSAGIGRQIITYAEDQLRAEGVKYVQQASPQGIALLGMVSAMDARDLCPLLTRLGYQPIEIIFAKEL